MRCTILLVLALVLSLIAGVLFTVPGKWLMAEAKDAYRTTWNKVADGP